MKDQPWDLNQTWPVGRNCCLFTNAFHKFLWLFSQIWDAKKLQSLDNCFRDFRTLYHISPERNVASTNKNAIV